MLASPGLEQLQGIRLLVRIALPAQNETGDSRGQEIVSSEIDGHFRKGLKTRYHRQNERLRPAPFLQSKVSTILNT